MWMFVCQTISYHSHMARCSGMRTFWLSINSEIMSYFRVNLILIVRSGFVGQEEYRRFNHSYYFRVVSMLLPKAGNIGVHEIHLWTTGSFAQARTEHKLGNPNTKGRPEMIF